MAFTTLGIGSSRAIICASTISQEHMPGCTPDALAAASRRALVAVAVRARSALSVLIGGALFRQELAGRASCGARGAYSVCFRVTGSSGELGQAANLASRALRVGIHLAGVYEEGPHPARATGFANSIRGLGAREGLVLITLAGGEGNALRVCLRRAPSLDPLVGVGAAVARFAHGICSVCAG